MNKKDSQIIQYQLMKRTVESVKSSTLCIGYTIIGAEAKIHRMRLSGRYDYGKLEKKVGRKLRIDETYSPKERMPNYKTKAYLQTQAWNLTIFLDPVSPFLPPCIIEFSYPTKEFLAWLCKLLPGLNVSWVEYALDIYCCDPLEVESLFWVLRRYLYVPYQKSTRQYGGLYFKAGERGKIRRIPSDMQEAEDGEEHKQSEEGAVFRVGPMKLYKRGPDKQKHRNSWFFEQVDRVRLELTSTGYYLQKHKLQSLKDFIPHPRFKPMCENLINFKRFRERCKGLPKEWEAYSAEDRDGNPGSFQQEYIQARQKKGKNLTNRIEDAKGFEEFKSMLISAMDGFDRKWALSPVPLESIFQKTNSRLRFCNRIENIPERGKKEYS